jgi:hypothetical protein
MSKEFEMSMIGELTFFLGFQVKQMREGIFISQEKYTKDLLKRFKMEECKPIKTPMPSNGHLDLDEGGKPIDQTLYHSMIGSLLYLITSRLDIIISVCMCARFQACPKEPHLSAVKRILRYVCAVEDGQYGCPDLHREGGRWHSCRYPHCCRDIDVVVVE